MMTDSPLKLVFHLLKNGLRYRYLRWRGKPATPQALSLEITHDCVSECIMCNIWRIPREVPNLPVEEWMRLLLSDLFFDLRELDITGGEPFLRTDLPDLFAGICGMKQKNLKALRSIAITTNGLLTKRVLEYTLAILQRLRAKNLDLVMVCAMDAVGGLHDKIRNHENAWEKVNQTIEGLVRFRDFFPNLIIGIKTTILPINVQELHRIARYADSKNIFTIISPCIVTEGRYLNQEKAKDLAFGPDDIETMIRFYQTGLFRWSYHADTLVQYLKTGRMKKPCSCGFNYFFVRSNGELFLCPLIDMSPGNILETPVKALFFSHEAARFRRRVGRYPECQQCTEPGLERYSLPIEGFTYLSLLSKMGKRRFLQLHYHMGLDKYFDFEKG